MKLNKAEVVSVVFTAIFVLLTAFTLLLFPGRGAVTVDLSRPAPPPAIDVSTEQTIVNINTAAKEELMTLPGVGEALAGRILAYRAEYGPFSEPGQLMEVSGIGAATFEGLKHQITIG